RHVAGDLGRIEHQQAFVDVLWHRSLRRLLVRLGFLLRGVVGAVEAVHARLDAVADPDDGRLHRPRYRVLDRGPFAGPKRAEDVIDQVVPGRPDPHAQP